VKKREFVNVPIRSIQNIQNSAGTSMFQISTIKEEKSNKKLRVEAHRHDFYHIMFIKEGIGVNTIDFKSYEVKPNSIFFISPGQVHALEISADVEGYVISFNSDFYLLTDSLQKLLDFPFFHSMNNTPVVYIEETDVAIKHTWEEIYDEYQTDQTNKSTILRALLEVLLIRVSRMYAQPLKEEEPAYLTYQLRKLETLIDTHFKELRVLNEYAELMHISPKHLNSLCKKGLNKTVTNLIHERTLIEAKRLLLFTNNSIAEIAHELGFTDKSYFMRFFKKHMNLTAQNYRIKKEVIEK